MAMATINKISYYRNNTYEWLIMTLLAVIMSDVFALMLSEEIFFKIDLLMIVLQFTYCGIFVFSSFYIGRLLAVMTVNYCHSHNYSIKSHDRLALCVVACVLNCAVAVVLQRLYMWLLPEGNTLDFSTGASIFCIIATLITLLNAMIHDAHFVVSQGQALNDLQKQTLRNNLNPHFVLNSLSSIAELIHSDPYKAEDYVVGLSRAYRFMLTHLEHDCVTIDESCAFIKQYVKLQNVRVPGTIQLEIDNLKPKANECLFSLSLQLLVENAIKHNYPDVGETLEINISREDDEIVVRNNRSKKHVSKESFGLGLESLTRRYQLQYMPVPVVRDCDEYFEVRMKIIFTNSKNE